MQTIIKALETKSPPPPQKKCAGFLSGLLQINCNVFSLSIQDDLKRCIVIFLRNLITPIRLGLFKKNLYRTILNDVLWKEFIYSNWINTFKKKIFTVYPTDGDAFEDGDEQNTPSSRVGIHDW